MIPKVESYRRGYEKGLRSLKGKIRMLFIFFLIEVCLASPFIGKELWNLLENKFAVAGVSDNPQANISQKEASISDVVEEALSLPPSDNIDLIVEKTRWLESQNGTKGLALSCKKRGLSNEYGYRANENFCFNNHEEATKEVKRWFTEKLSVMDIKTACCLYTGNGKIKNCNRSKQIAYGT